MANGTCETCCFYLPDPENIGQGFCRRKAPGEYRDSQAYQVTLPADYWCGEHPDRAKAYQALLATP